VQTNACFEYVAGRDASQVDSFRTGFVSGSLALPHGLRTAVPNELLGDRCRMACVPRLAPG
jgi:hypothetical protein